MNLPTLTVLMVEDLAADRDLYRRALRQDSSCVYELLEAESLAAGLALCQTRSIDAVLLDYLLPDGNGLDFLERLLVQSNGSSPPVVMISGYGNERIAVRAIKLGAADYLVKSDLTAELLLATIRSALQDAATFDYETRINAAQALSMARRYGFTPDEKGFREMAPQVWPGGKFTPSICASIDTPPEEANKRVVIPLPL